MDSKQIRAMIVGDSMTQGGEGDYTWRYRLWEWIHDQQVDITFTGPYKGTQEPDEPSPPKPPPLYKTWDPPPAVRCHGGYAKGVASDFDSHHFAVWGRQCAQAKDVIEDVVEQYSPDTLLVMLGFNDIGWCVSDAKGTIASMKIFIAKARKAKPDLRFVIANIPQRTKMDDREDLPKSTAEYNRLLQHGAKEWSQAASPIYLADVCKYYTADEASFDGLHPNSLGDYQIACAFASTLHYGLHLGLVPLVVPEHIPIRPLPAPSNFQLLSSPVGVTAVWDQVYGAYGYEFRSRVNDGDYSEGPCGANRWDSHWTGDGDRYEAQVRSLYGTQARSEWTPIRCAVAHPKLAPPPTNITIRSAKEGVIIRWEPPSGPNTEKIIQYSVIWVDKDEPGMFPGLGAFKQSPAHIDELKTGHTYDIGMLTWNTAGEGLPGPMQQFRVGDETEH